MSHDFLFDDSFMILHIDLVTCYRFTDLRVKTVHDKLTITVSKLGTRLKIVKNTIFNFYIELA